MSTDDGDTFAQAVFPVSKVYHRACHDACNVGQSQASESHYSLVDAHEGVALVAVEHQAFILYEKVYLDTPVLQSLDKAKTEMTKADFTPDTINELCTYAMALGMS